MIVSYFQHEITFSFQDFLNEVFESEQNHFNNNFLMGFENRQALHKPPERQCPVRSIEHSSTLSNLKESPVPYLNMKESSSSHGRKLMPTYQQGKVEP